MIDKINYQFSGLKIEVEVNACDTPMKADFQGREKLKQNGIMLPQEYEVFVTQ
jgi:hypothetical protein